MSLAIAIEPKSGSPQVMSAEPARLRSGVEREMSAPGKRLPDMTGEIYASLARHQRMEAWGQRRFVGWLQEWAERFDVEFKLHIPEIALRVDVLRCTERGSFRREHNGLGLRGEITINALYAGRAAWEVLGALLHERLHGWQQTHGRPARKRGYHNAEFRHAARQQGLIVDSAGRTVFHGHGAFMQLLRRHGVRVPAGEMVELEPVACGRSKLKKWSCGCNNVRCASALHATCNDCGRQFVEAAARATRMAHARETVID